MKRAASRGPGGCEASRRALCRELTEARLTAGLRVPVGPDLGRLMRRHVRWLLVLALLLAAVVPAPAGQQFPVLYQVVDLGFFHPNSGAQGVALDDGLTSTPLPRVTGLSW